jgi:hypothetical protein
VENGPFIIWFAIVMTNKLNTVYLISLAHGVTFFSIQDIGMPTVVVLHVV